MRKNNTRKRAIALIMASMMAASLAGCGGGTMMAEAVQTPTVLHPDHLLLKLILLPMK